MVPDCKKRCGSSQIRNRFTYMTTGNQEERWKEMGERKWKAARQHTALAINSPLTFSIVMPCTGCPINLFNFEEKWSTLE